jgi:hypothetical protein
MSAYFSGSLVEQYGSTPVFLLTAVFPLIVSASALLIDEQRVPGRQQAAAVAVGAGSAQRQQQHMTKQQQQQQQLQPPQQHVEQLAISRASSSGLVQQLVHQGGALWGAVKQKHILLPTVFVFLWQVGLLISPLTACPFMMTVLLFALPTAWQCAALCPPTAHSSSVCLLTHHSRRR